MVLQVFDVYLGVYPSFTLTLSCMKAIMAACVACVRECMRELVTELTSLVWPTQQDVSRAHSRTSVRRLRVRLLFHL